MDTPSQKSTGSKPIIIIIQVKNGQQNDAYVFRLMLQWKLKVAKLTHSNGTN